MITRPTVLILGAGASMPYGFPSGPKLVEAICGITEEGTVQNRLIQGVLAQATFPGEVARFGRELRESGRTSIDAFLQHRSEEFMAIGKLAIAAALIPNEVHGRLYDGFKWYHYLFNKLNASFSEFAANKLSIITYNYDRSLEYFILNALMQSYGKSQQDAIAAMRHIPIIHVHGNLGSLPYFGKQYRKYDTQLSGDSIVTAYNCIRIIHEPIDHDPVFDQIHSLLLGAEVIAFLGFGYDETNLDRLRIPIIEATKGKKLIFGTAFGLGDSERQTVMDYFNERITLSERNVVIDDFLKDYPVLTQHTSFNDRLLKKIRNNQGA